MGQIINVTGTVSGESAIFESDRGLSGQDGGSYESIEETVDDTTFPALLAARVFESDTAVNRVFTGSNSVVIRRSGGWTDADVGNVGAVIEEFFVFYRE